MHVLVTLVDGRRLRLDVVDAVVYEAGGAPVVIAHSIPGGIVRVGHCRDNDWDQLCTEAGLADVKKLPDIK